jgi:predicted DNA-binding protein
MSAQVTVTLPNDLIERAQVWADQSGRPLADFLAETIEVSLTPFGAAPVPVGEWTNEDVLAALDFQLPPEDDGRLSDLLSRQREDGLSTTEAIELRRLMTMYQENLLRKSVALREAVRRDLRKSPAP